MSAPPGLDPSLAPLSLLLAAMGGGERLRSVRTFVREALRVRRRRDGAVLAAERVLTYRAAGGFVRIETFPLPTDDGSELSPSSRIIVTPNGARPHPPDADQVLREVSLEPRSLLAHAHERALVVREESDGTVEIVDRMEEALYRFDPRSFLCTVRRDTRLGGTTHHLDWRCAAGIATPFVEIAETDEIVSESRIVGVAYDLPLPVSLFAREPRDLKE